MRNLKGQLKSWVPWGSRILHNTGDNNYSHPPTAVWDTIPEECQRPKTTIWQGLPSPPVFTLTSKMVYLHANQLIFSCRPRYSCLLNHPDSWPSSQFKSCARKQWPQLPIIPPVNTNKILIVCFLSGRTWKSQAVRTKLDSIPCGPVLQERAQFNRTTKSFPQARRPSRLLSTERTQMDKSFGWKTVVNLAADHEQQSRLLIWGASQVRSWLG